MPIRRKYESSQMFLALEQVHQGCMTQRQVSTQRKVSISYGVPGTTLIDKIHGRTPDMYQPGQPPAISTQDDAHSINISKR